MALEQEQLFLKLQKVDQFLEDGDHDIRLTTGSSVPPIRTITMRADSRLDKNKLLLLAAAYKFEQITSSTLATYAEDISELSDAWPLTAELLREYHKHGLKELLAHKTDALTRLTYMTRGQTPTRIDELRDGGLVEEVYEHCTKPNAHDLDVLARALRDQPKKIADWLKWKQSQMEHVSWISADTRLATAAQIFDVDARTFSKRLADMSKRTDVDGENTEEDQTGGMATDGSYESDPLGGSDTDSYESDALLSGH